MKLTNVILAGALGIATVSMLLYLFLDKESPDKYKKKILEKRKEINHFMRFNEKSPIPDSIKKSFKELNYFEPNITYKVKAKLTPYSNKKLLTMLTNTGIHKEYIQYGFITFQLFENPYKLNVFQALDETNKKSYFIPFLDKTNGKETYFTGRYLDVVANNQNSVILDFNLAYNPYCAYSKHFSCPIPPKENHLNIAVLAGEKKFSKNY